MSSLKYWREEKNISQEELAKLSDMSVSSIRAYEQGLKHIEEAKFKTLLSIGNVLGVPFWYLFDDSDLSASVAYNVGIISPI